MFMWQIMFLDTEEIAEKTGFEFPHTAQASSTWHLKSRLRSGISTIADRIIITIKMTDTGTVIRDSGEIIISDIVS